MKIMSYNILQGGNLSGGDRTKKILEVVKGVRPDILGLAECTAFERDGEARLKMICKELAMKGTMNRSNSGNHVAILYHPDLDIARIDGSSITMYNGYTRLLLRTAELGEVSVVVSHLTPFSSLFRTAEAQMLAVRASSTLNAVVMGDLNSIAPTDLPVDLDRASRNLRARLIGTDGWPDTKAIEVLLAQGFQDLGAKTKDWTYPTEMKREAEGARVRVDYVFASPELARRCHHMEALDTPTTNHASDHLPLVAEFELQ